MTSHYLASNVSNEIPWAVRPEPVPILDGIKTGNQSGIFSAIRINTDTLKCFVSRLSPMHYSLAFKTGSLLDFNLVPWPLAPYLMLRSTLPNLWMHWSELKSILYYTIVFHQSNDKDLWVSYVFFFLFFFFFVYAVVVNCLYSCFYFVSAPWAPSRVDMCTLQIFTLKNPLIGWHFSIGNTLLGRHCSIRVTFGCRPNITHCFTELN